MAELWEIESDGVHTRVKRNGEHVDYGIRRATFHGQVGYVPQLNLYLHAVETLITHKGEARLVHETCSDCQGHEA